MQKINPTTMQQQQNPNEPQKNEVNQPGTTGNTPDRLNTNNPAQQSAGAENNDYKRDDVHLGGSATGNQNTSAGTQKGGGGSGYDVNREQQEVNKQQEQMHQERDQDDLQVERTQTPQPETDPGREHPDTNPQQPETRPGTSTMG